ncbi:MULTISPECIES: type II toxin-antitoxin system PemK/MazF family toxin [unclassified Rickettsia]|uniref:type II toxin-antitoxin system PemK/MazF family toxin n=1 Tax=unclassified Rickettsia TaxID=114295 RepID=UPI003132FAB8
MTLKINLGEIWLADLNPKVGSEPGKTRPVLIIQDQVLLDASHPSTLIIPLTTNLIDDAFPLRIRIKAHNKLEKDSDLLIDQIRSIDNKRLILGPLTSCNPTTMQIIYKAVLEVIGVKI